MDKVIFVLTVVAAAITFWAVTTTNHLYVG
jgi:hypothetical protein